MYAERFKTENKTKFQKQIMKFKSSKVLKHIIHFNTKMSCGSVNCFNPIDELTPSLASGVTKLTGKGRLVAIIFCGSLSQVEIG
jgi:hypothetical protein